MVVSTRRPNILLITTDTQRCDTLQCMGSTFAVSPHIDRLAAEGVLFDNAHTASPVCSPARTSLLTGLHTPLHGCIENGINPRKGLETFPDLLHEQGYTNLMIGKTHFGDYLHSFDVIRDVKGEKNASSNEDSYGLFIRNHGYSRASSDPQSRPEHLHLDAFLVDTTIEEIERARNSEEDKPFFAFCSLLSPHSPLDPPGEWATMYDSIPLPPIDFKSGDLVNLPLHTKRLMGFIDKEAELEEDCLSKEGQEKIDKKRRLYYGLSSFVDAQIGRLLDYLDRSGLRENTLIIFTSDHGTQLYDHGFDDKHNYFDTSWRVPFIMSMPGTLPSGERRDFAVWTDITATILAAAGTKSRYVQGLDLVGPLAQGERSPRRCAVGTLYKSAALATRRWKLEYYFEEHEGRLYDRDNDPSEHNDLFNNPRYGEVKHALLQALLTWRADISDLQFTTEAQTGGGPVASRIKAYTMSMSGAAVELRLGEQAEKIDAMVV
jgi:arylsulfatase A-like enzyme